MDGKVLLIGVNHDADTMVHLAELLANVPYRVSRYCTVIQEGNPVRIEYEENDHCCMRFALVDEWLYDKGLQSEVYVGHAHARLARSKDIVEVSLAHLALDSLIFLHSHEERCSECCEAIKSIKSLKNEGVEINGR